MSVCLIANNGGNDERDGNGKCNDDEDVYPKARELRNTRDMTYHEIFVSFDHFAEVLGYDLELCFLYLLRGHY